MALFPAALGSTTTCHSAAAPPPVRQKANPGGGASGTIAAMSIWVAALCTGEPDGQRAAAATGPAATGCAPPFRGAEAHLTSMTGALEVPSRAWNAPAEIGKRPLSMSRAPRLASGAELGRKAV